MIYVDKMAKLETIVRNSLIEQRAEELVKYFSETPKLKLGVIKLVKSLVDSMTQTLDLDDEEMTEIRAGIESQIKAQFNNPEQLREALYEGARNSYLSVRQAKTKLGSLFERLKEDGQVSESVVSDCRKAYSDCLKFGKINGTMVRRLVKIAETDGVDKAMQTETRYSVIREMFPTSRAYKLFVQGGNEAINKFIQQVQDALMTGGEDAKGLGQIFGVVKKSQRDFLSLGADYLKREIKKIYG